MERLRGIIRAVLLVIWTACAYARWQFGRLVVRLQRGDQTRWAARSMHSWARLAVPLIGMRVAAFGPPPRSASLLVTNHVSYVDILLLASRCECVFLAKRDVAEWPIIGAMAQQLGMLFVERERRTAVVQANELIAAYLQRGISVVLFPEGTSSNGTTVLPFHSSLLEPAARLGQPVTYGCIQYSVIGEPHTARERVCWWGDMTFTDHLFKLLCLRKFTAQIAFGAAPLPAMERKRLAVALHQAVSGLHTAINRGNARRATMRPVVPDPQAHAKSLTK